MMRIQKSAAYERQLKEFAKDYRDRAGIETADRFLDGIDEAVEFIAKMPQACAVAYDLKTIDGLEDYEFRKWRVNGFPHAIFFRIEDDILMLQAIYAHKMNVLKRFPSEINVMSGGE